jgi:3-deoxy-D-manno-octulosonic-acid transferase
VSLPALLWRAATSVAVPLLPLHLALRARRRKENASRLAERRGKPGGAARPSGTLFWLHAASVGEVLSVLPVLEAMAARTAPGLALLVTTGTVTSAEILARRASPALTARLIHRFVPLDVPAWAARFLDAWKPDAGAFVESELWPNLLAEARARGLPLALVNARMSARSARHWSWLPGFAAELLGSFRLVLAQGEGDAARLRALGARSVQGWGNLKAAAPPLPVDAAELDRLRAHLAGRPVFLAASIHPGEEAPVAAAHRAAAARLPGLLTILVPRHPERGAAMAAALAPHGRVARRSLGELPGPDTAFWLADTLGELGLFYRLAGACLMGGTLVPRGGQNPLEPARLRCPVLLGPHTQNFAEPVARLLGAGAAQRVAAPGCPKLAEALVAVLSEPRRAQAMADAAAAVADDHTGLPERVAAALLELLPEEKRPGAGIGISPAAAQDALEGRGPVEA